MFNFSTKSCHNRRATAPATRLLTAAAAAALVALAPAAQAQAQTENEVLVVTGTRTPQRVDQALAEVTVIDRVQLDRATGRTLSEVLAQQPGIQFWSNGGLGKASSVSIRGLESRHVLLLIDGVRYGSATLGTANFDNLPLDAIERIEIVRGPLSGLYGSDAVGGVVQVFTRHGANGLAINGTATAGSHGYAQAGGGLRFGSGIFDGSVQVERTRDRGFSATNPKVQFGNYNPDDDGFSQTSASAQLGVNLPGGWRADGRVLQSKAESHFDDGPGADALAGSVSRVASLQLGGPVLAAWRTSLRVARSADDAETIRSASVFTALGTITTVQQQLSWDNTVSTPLGTVLLVADSVKQTVSRPGAPFAVSDRRIDGVALGLNGEAGAHHWQVSARRDRNSQFGNQNNGTLGYGYDVTPQLRIAAAAGSSFVMPSFNQLYYPGFGNPSLLPEKGNHREFSLRWADAGQQVRAAYFENHIRGYISSGPLPTNIPYAKADGISLSYEAVVANWTLSASGDLLDARNDAVTDANYGRSLPRRAQNSLRAAADVTLGAFRLGGTLQDVGDRYDNAANTLAVAGYTTLDLRADWRVASNLTLGLKLNNVAGVQYETAYGYNQPGREFFLTLRYSGL